MSFDEAKSRKSSSVVHDDSIGYIERTSADTKVDQRNTAIIRNIDHIAQLEEHDPDCEACRKFVTPYPNRWSKYR